MGGEISIQELKEKFVQQDSDWSNQTHYCPHCDPSRPKYDPWRESQCILNKPLLMVIPPEGAHLSCPVHPAGHHVFGPGVTWCESYTQFSNYWNGQTTTGNYSGQNTVEGLYDPLQSRAYC